jgi:hypothetical protein
MPAETFAKKWFAFSVMDKNSVENIINTISELI